VLEALRVRERKTAENANPRLARSRGITFPPWSYRQRLDLGVGSSPTRPTKQNPRCAHTVSRFRLPIDVTFGRKGESRHDRCLPL
jgi:hypothetical protein